MDEGKLKEILNLHQLRLNKDPAGKIADLRGAYLARVNLKEAYLTKANLEGADLEGADLTGADLEGADLTGAIHSFNIMIWLLITASCIIVLTITPILAIIGSLVIIARYFGLWAKTKAYLRIIIITIKSLREALYRLPKDCSGKGT